MGEMYEILTAIHAAFTPSAPIQSEALFAGRLEQLNRLVETIMEPGQHAVLYGERGVGKTSLANVVAKKLNDAVKISCDPEDDFSTIWRRVLAQIEFEEFPADAPEQLTLFNLDTKVGDDAAKAAELARFLEKHSVEGLIVIDEYDQVEDDATRRAMAVLLKHLSDNWPLITILTVGVADDVTALIGEHPSVERCLRQIHLPRMSPEELHEIISHGAEATGINFEDQVASTIVQSSQGFPYFTHLLAKHAALACARDGRDLVAIDDFSAGLLNAVGDAQASIISAYRKAVEARRDNLYKEVLLAAAMAPTSELGEFWPKDMEGPLSAICERPFTVNMFFSHLGRFCSADRGAILEQVGQKGRYRYRFANPLMKPYVLLQGLNQGINVGEILARQ